MTEADHMRQIAEKYAQKGKRGEITTDVLCPSCGYNLRGLRHGTRCPECGSDAYTRRGNLIVANVESIDASCLTRMYIGFLCILGVWVCMIAVFVLQYIRFDSSWLITLYSTSAILLPLSAWLITRKRPDQPEFHNRRYLVKAVVYISLTTSVLQLATLASSIWATPKVATVIGYISFALYITTQSVLCVWLERIANWVRFEQLGRRLWAFAWFIPILMVLSIPSASFGLGSISLFFILIYAIPVGYLVMQVWFAVSVLQLMYIMRWAKLYQNQKTAKTERLRNSNNNNTAL